MSQIIRRGAGRKGTLWYDSLDGVEFFVWRPSGYEDFLAPLPCVYALDGQMLLEHPLEFSSLGPKQFWNLDSTIERLIGDGSLAPVMFAGTFNAASARHEQYIPYVYERARAFADFFRNDFIPCIEAQYGAGLGSGERAFLGSSLGGLMALHMLKAYPDGFRTIGALSVHDPWLEGNAGALKPQGTKLYLDAGTLEYQDGRKYLEVAEGLFPADLAGRLGKVYSYTATARRMLRALLANGYEYGYDLFYREEQDGRHCEPFWERRVANFLLLFQGKPAGLLVELELSLAAVRDKDLSVHFYVQAVGLFENGLRYSLLTLARYALEGEGSVNDEGEFFPIADGNWKIAAEYQGLRREIALSQSDLNGLLEGLPALTT